MDRRRFVAGLTASGCAPRAVAAPEPDAVEALYQRREWFALRERTRGAVVQPFYAAAAALACGEPQAKALTRAVMNGDSAHRAEARSLLVDAYYRTGRYAEAADEANRLRRERPADADVRNTQSILDALRPFGDQAVERHRPSRVPMTVIDTSFYLPVSVNGVSAHYAFDTGASMSVISRAEAQRLGLAVTRTGGHTDSITDQSLGIDVTSAPRLQVGEVELRNVGFFVFPDEQPPFSNLPTGCRGILGLPVLLALRTISWSAAKNEFWMSHADQSRRHVGDLAFDGSAMAVRVRFQGRPITLAFDTGAQKMVLYPKFALAAPEAVRGARSTIHTLTGVGGASSLAARALQPVVLDVGGRPVTLREPVIIDGRSGAASGYYVGNLGMDLLNQAQVTTVDFSTMKLSLR